MAYVLVQDGVVVQKQPDPADGFIEAPESVVCGFLYAGGEFTQPPVPERAAPPPMSPTEKLAEFLSANPDVMDLVSG